MTKTEEDIRRGVANDIEVRPSTADNRADPDIAHVDALRKASEDKITLTVMDRRITLEGEAGWDCPRSGAAAVFRSRGLKGAVNRIKLITLKPKIASTAVRRQVEDALKRSAEVENVLSINVWPMPWEGAPRRWRALQGKGQGCFSL